jgi:hypothetical protein
LKPWGNAEVREYTFAEEDDDDAVVLEVKKIAKEGADDPTSSQKFTY